MRIGLEEARAFWAHPSQHDYGMSADDLPVMAYYAQGGVCLAFEASPLPGVWFVHVGVKPEVWGFVDAPAKWLLREFAADFGATRVVAWIEERKRHAAALARRVGFDLDGRFPGVLMFGWRP